VKQPDPNAERAEVRVRFPHLEREITANAGETLFHAARRHGVRIVAACGGRGVCGTCQVRVLDGEVVPHAASAGDTVVERPGEPAWVRACQFTARGDCSVEISSRSLAPIVRAEAHAPGTERLPLDPAVLGHDLTVAAPSLDDPRSDAGRVAAALSPGDAGLSLEIDVAAARTLPGLLRAGLKDGEATLRAWRYGRELIGFAPGGTRALGLAIDLGTTNIAGFLVDLETGERLATLAVENPQVAWGGDVISRINHAMQSPGAAVELQTAVTEALNGLAHDLCQALGAGTDTIVDVAVCGNTAMHHLLLGLPVRQLGRAPFVAALGDALDVRARDFGLAVAPGARAHLPANIQGFVGGDHMMALLATEDRWRGSRASVVMDIGTNTEITVIHEGRIHSASAPSGPALEGGHISCGMRAAEGAIEKVWLEDGQVRFRTLAGKAPIGLCGSGVLDAVAALSRGGLINGTGRIQPGHAAVTEDAAGNRAVRLAPAVALTQADVRAVQLAKAAVRAATDLLIEAAGLSPDQLDQVLIAGAFGAYLDVQSGIDIGLFPSLPRERFDQVGNAAGQGVRQVVASVEARDRAVRIAKTCRYVELSSRTDFQKTFMRHIAFPGISKPGTPNEQTI